MNITLDDASPQFQFIGSGWITNHTADTLTYKYFDQTFYGTHTDGDHMILTFNGTAIYVYGAKRLNHGLYSTQIDGGNLQYQLGYNAGADMQALLFSAGGLSPNSEHTVVITNLPSQTTPPATAIKQWWLDIDYAVITTAVTGQVYTTRYDDTHPDVQYGGSGWGDRLTSTLAQLYYNSTGHASGTVGDTFGLEFNGSSIQVFGGLNVGHGNYDVRLDGLAMGNFNGTAWTLQPQVSLFVASNLTEGPHRLLVTNTGGGSRGNALDLDYIVVNSTINPTPINNGTNTTTSSTSGKTNIAAIAGGAAGGAAAMLILVGLIWWFACRGRRRGEGYYDNRVSTPIDLTGDEVKPYRNDSTPMNEIRDPYKLSTEALPYGATPSARAADQSGTPFLSVIPPPPGSNATSYPHSVVPSSEVGSPGQDRAGGGSDPVMGDNTESDGIYATRGPGGGYARGALNPLSSDGISVQSPRSIGYPPSSHTFGNVNTSTETTTLTTTLTTTTPHPTQKAQLRALPFTARQSSPYTDSVGSFSPEGRMRREGREVDMGPVPVEGDEEERRDGVLPPDYQQATEPLPGQRREGQM